MLSKICVSCKTQKPLSDFNKNKNSSDGHKEYCRNCASEQNRIYREKNREKINKKKREEYWDSKSDSDSRTAQELLEEKRVCTVCRVEKNILDFYKRGNGGFYNYCKSCHNKNTKQYVEENRDQVLERKREYYKKTRKSQLKYFKQYNIENSISNVERAKKWRLKNPDRYRELIRQAQQRRSAKGLLLENNFSNDEWVECVNYFRNSDSVSECAYCGKVDDNLTQDHFIPLSKGGPYTKENIIPICLNCNSQKSNTDFYEWYPTKEFYSIEKLIKIEKYLDEINYDNPEPSEAVML